MNNLQNVKTVRLSSPQTIDNTTHNTGSADCKGFLEALLLLTVGNIDIDTTVCKLQESDDDSAWSDVSGGGASTLPLATGGDNKVTGWYVDLQHRKRYLRLVITIGDGIVGAVISAHALLASPQDGLDTAAKRGLDVQMVIGS